MPRRLVIIGGGEHARVLVEVARSRQDVWEVEGFVDPEPCLQMQDELHVIRLGTDEDLLRRLERESDFWVVLGIGGHGPSARRRTLVERLAIANAKWAAVIDASARISPTAKLGVGVVVMPGVVVNCNAVLGNHCVINSAAVIEHDVRVGDFVQVSPGATIGGGAILEEDCYVGLGARIRDHVTVGQRAIVGMGAAVVRDVPPRALVVGVPAKVKEK